MTLLTYILIFWFGSTLLWYPFWISIVTVIIERKNLPMDYVPSTTFVLSIAMSPIAWFVFPTTLFQYIFRKDRSLTMQELMHKIFKEIDKRKEEENGSEL